MSRHGTLRQKPVLVGMCNPYPRERAGSALLPAPAGSAGHRLWKLTALSRPLYLRGFERTNIIPGDVWDAARARLHADAFRQVYAGRVVVLLGASVWRAFGFRRVAPLRFIDYKWNRYYYLPHPSGKNRWYNDADNREATGALLRRLRHV